MIKKISLLVFFITSFFCISGQPPVSTTDMFKRTMDGSGELNIRQDPSLDSLINRYILQSKKIYDETGYFGMNGWRIQIYNSSNRNAREESDKVRAEFMSKFPTIVSYKLYSEPGYFKIRVGDFRSKAEATSIFLKISKLFPNAYIVPDIIEFPELTKK